jgi:GPH family glycoside/pentoside/hexuronide:cation symporter
LLRKTKMQDKQQKLSVREKIGFGLGDTASNLFFQTSIYFLLYFYTDVFGISAVAIGTMFLVTRIWDAVNDPMMGAIADRTNTRWGKFRPYLFWFAVPFGILGVLMFTTPNLDSGGKLIWAYVTYTLMMMVYTAINVPYCALMGVISPNSMERTVVSSYRFVLAFVGMFIVQYSLVRMVEIFGGKKDSAQGWQYAMGVLFALAVILFLITFFTTRERVRPMKEQKNPLKQDLADLFANGPWLLIGGATVFQLTYILIRGGSIVYYFDYYIQNQDVSLFGKVFNLSSTQLASAFMLSGTAITILGAVMTKWFCRFIDKPKAYAVFLAITAITTGLVYFLSPQNVVLLFVLQLFTSFSMGPVSVLQWAIYADTADHSEWKTGRRATALIMAASLFALKLGVALGGAILAWVLAGYGYKPNQPQTPEALQGIRLAMSMYAAIPAVIGVIIMAFYPLTNQLMTTIETDLIERRKQNEPDLSVAKGM